MVYDLDFKFLWYHSDEGRSLFVRSQSWRTFEELVKVQNMYEYTDNFLNWLDEQLADEDWNDIEEMLYSMTIEELCEEWEIETDEEDEE